MLVKSIHISDRMAVKFNHDVLFPESRKGCGTVGLNRNHQEAALDWQMMEAHQPPVQFDILAADADVAAPDSAVLDEPAGHIFCRVDRDSTAHALGRQND